MDGTAAPGTHTPYAREDHVHPTDTSRYAATNPSGYQTAAQVTAVLPVASSIAPVMDGVAAVGDGTAWARSNHVHPSDTSRAPIASPTFTGMVTAPDITLSTDASQSAFSGAWTVTNPTPTPGAGAFTAATATVRCKKIGRTVFVNVVIAITTVGTGSGYVTINLPFAVASPTVLSGRETALTGKALAGQAGSAGSAFLAIYNFDGTSAIGAGVSLVLSGVYEANA